MKPAASYLSLWALEPYARWPGLELFILFRRFWARSDRAEPSGVVLELDFCCVPSAPLVDLRPARPGRRSAAQIDLGGLPLRCLHFSNLTLAGRAAAA